MLFLQLDFGGKISKSVLFVDPVDEVWSGENLSLEDWAKVRKKKEQRCERKKKDIFNLLLQSTECVC
jgi:hypothetical protein